MSDNLRTRNRLLLLEVEAASGTEESPTVGANACKCENLRWSTNFPPIQTNEHTGSLDGAASIVGGGRLGFNFDVLLKGAATAGQAPEWGPNLRAAAMAETLTAADVTGTAQAGTAGSVTLAVGASATDDIYKGMVIEFTGGTGSGQAPRVITAYNGTTKVATVTPNFAVTPDATSAYAIRANALYVPASSSLETVTAWAYQLASDAGNAILRRLKGSAAALSFTLAPTNIGRMSVTLDGVLAAAPAEVADPGAATFETGVPEPIIGAQAYLGQNAIKFTSLTFNLGNQLAAGIDPAEAYGFDRVDVASRRISGRLNPRITDLATRDVFADMLAPTERALWLNWGATAGNRLSVLFPSVRPVGQEDEDVDGIAADGVPFEATGVDSGVYICVY